MKPKKRDDRDVAARVWAFRRRAAYPGHRFDIYLGEEAAAVMSVLKKQSGLSASAVVDGVLRGVLKLPSIK